MILLFQKKGECNYWYEEVPKSPNNSVCNITEGSTVYLTCAVYYPCDNISIKWYKSRTEMDASDDVIRGNGECINSSADGKYLQIVQAIGGTTNDSNFEDYCYASFLLLIHHFIQNDNGNYWCQIVANSCPLEPSLYAYISPSFVMSNAKRHNQCNVSDLIYHFSPAQCAENITSIPSSRLTCNSQSTTTTAATAQTEQNESVTETTFNNKGMNCCQQQ